MADHAPLCDSSRIPFFEQTAHIRSAFAFDGVASSIKSDISRFIGDIKETYHRMTFLLKFGVSKVNDNFLFYTMSFILLQRNKVSK